MSTRPADPRWPTARDWLAAPADGAVDLAVLGIPTYATSISPTSAHKTPAAVRLALQRLSTWCPSRGVDLAGSVTALDLGDVDDPDLDDEGAWRTAIAAKGGAERAPLVVALGGDNSLTAPFAAGVLGDFATAGLVTLDAHHDIREGRSNGSPVRQLLDGGIAGERIVQVGIADWANSRSYADEAHARGITVMHRATVAGRGIETCLDQAVTTAAAAGGRVLVDLDLDVCDRSVAPACPASLPGGLSAAEILAAAYACGRDPRVSAVDVTEVDAGSDRDPDGRTVRLAAMVLLELAAGLAVRLGRATGQPATRS